MSIPLKGDFWKKGVKPLGDIWFWRVKPLGDMGNRRQRGGKERQRARLEEEGEGGDAAKKRSLETWNDSSGASPVRGKRRSAPTVAFLGDLTYT
jgi:hypothetical protein